MARQTAARHHPCAAAIKNTMKTNTKSSRPTKRYGIFVNNQPYGLLSAVNWVQAASYFHKLTNDKFRTPAYDIVVQEISI